MTIVEVVEAMDTSLAAYCKRCRILFPHLFGQQYVIVSQFTFALACAQRLRPFAPRVEFRT